jgi:hypothetical protein
MKNESVSFRFSSFCRYCGESKKGEFATSDSEEMSRRGSEFLMNEE